MRSAWIQIARSSGSPGGHRGAPRPVARAWRRGTFQAIALLAVAGALSTTPVRSLAQSGGILRPLADPDRLSLLDDGDPDSLRTAVAQSLAWLDRQPSGRWLAFGPRRVATAEYAAGLRQLLMLLAGNPPPESLEERVLTEFDVLSSVGRGDGAVLLTGYHEPVVEASDRPSPQYPVAVLGLPADFTGGWRYPRFLSNQDTGGAIRGPGRVDLFWGRRSDAVLAASEMKQLGELYFLVPKPSRRVVAAPPR